MRIVTNIDIPDYVYLFFSQEAKKWASKSPEDLMAAYLARYVRRVQARQKKATEQSK